MWRAEEWIKKRKVEQVTTKQIETRVKRQVVVNEDGQVLDDSGPQVTTRTTEDTETKREEHTEVIIVLLVPGERGVCVWGGGYSGDNCNNNNTINNILNTQHEREKEKKWRHSNCGLAESVERAQRYCFPRHCVIMTHRQKN